MNLVVLGATGGVGRHAVRLAAERGHKVAAVARRPEADAYSTRWVIGDVRNTGALTPLLHDAEAVLWCVGVTKTSGGRVGRTALPPLLDAMVEFGVPRFVGVSGAGADLPGDHKGLGARLISGLTHRLGRDLVEDKEGEYQALAASSLDWTQVRPPRLVDRPGTGRYSLTDDAPGLRAKAVPKADVALAMLDLAENRRWLGAAPFLVASSSR
jgi:putative NADH-flavin reductase